MDRFPRLLGAVIVAPHTGAWIETQRKSTGQYSTGEVAPHTGAWIETMSPWLVVPQLLCRPSHRGVD